ncbi:MAG: AAA family ATPase [Chloroflexi bacterium]|nr:AAA family ATPase [Chloroflexota bacterium]
MITRLRVENYKSLKDFDLRLKPLTVFVGANNAGKSNILDCFSLLADLINQGAGAIHSRGGFRDLVWNGEINRSISFIFEGVVEWKGKHNFTYHLELVGGPDHFSIAKEQFSVIVDGEPRPLLRQEPQGGVTLLNEDGVATNFFNGDRSSPSLRVTPSIAPNSFTALFVKGVSQWTRFSFESSKMQVPPPARRETTLEQAGANLSAVLHTLQTEYPRDFQRVKEALQVVVPELEDLYTPLTEGGQTLVRIREQGLSFATPLWALSDGTLHALAILASLYVPTPPPILCFEEPENFVHPRVLEVFLDAFQDISSRGQVLISTHSPYLVNLLRPENLVIVEKVNGATKARPASKQRGIKEALRVLGLGEYWYSGAMGGVPRSVS